MISPRSHTLLIYILLLSAASIFSLSASGQEKERSWIGKFIQRSIADTTAPGKRSIRYYPTLAYTPETSFEFGISALLLYQAKGDTLNRLSEVNAFGFVTVKGQYGIWLDNALYSDKDKWFFLGRSRWQKFPLLYYGTGPATPGDDPAVVDGNYLLLRQRVLHKIVPDFFGGFEVDYQRLSKSEFKQPDGYTYPLPLGYEGSSNLGLGVALVYDNRHNVLNVRKGMFTEISFLDYRKKRGSDYNFTSYNLDFRSFHPMRRNQVLAWQVVGNFLSGEVPFNQLALLGGEMIMRGYYQGRYRDKNLLAAQAEYRFLPLPFSKRFGAVLFSGIGTVSPRIGEFQAAYARFTAGGGVRYLLFPRKDIFLRFDVGFTRDGAGFYLYTGEAF